MGSTTRSERPSLDAQLIEQSRLAIERARRNLERFRDGGLSSIRPLCESAQELEHAVSVLRRCGKQFDLLREARVLLELFRGTDKSLLSLANRALVRPKEAANNEDSHHC